MDKELLDIYTDYLISSFSQVTATGLSELTDGDIGHDRVTRFLSASDYTSKNLWLLIKPEIRRLESFLTALTICLTADSQPHARLTQRCLRLIRQHL